MASVFGLDDITYEIEPDRLVCNIRRNCNFAAPRRLICFSGVLFPVVAIRESHVGLGITISSDCLRSLCIPSSVAHVGTSSFDWRWNLVYVVFEPGSQLYILPGYVFHCCPSLRSICVPATVGVIGDCAFLNCDKLGRVTFEANSRLSSIGHEALAICPNLTVFEFPAGFDRFNPSAFSWSYLSLVSIEPGNRHFAVSGCWFLNAEQTVILAHIGRATDLSIPSHIEGLGRSCFANQESLSRITFEPGSRLRRIGSSAMYRCKSLRSVVIPAGVEAIESATFSHCAVLQEVIYEPRSTPPRIDPSAFWECPKNIRFRTMARSDN
jgi:hypothetical protein